VTAFLSKLEAAPVGILTYGLAFHPEYTRVLRYGSISSPSSVVAVITFIFISFQ
jgi:hypothetical protein